MKRVVLVLVLGACDDQLDQRLAIVTDTRVLAIVSDPAEVKPGDMATYTALVASPTGPVTDAPAWTLCDQPKPPTEDNAVSAACVTAGMPLGTGATITATILPDACALFGPDVPPGGFRPRDPDPSGGFYQPVRADVAAAPRAFGFTRVTCNLGSAPADVAHDYQLRYVANTNPTLDAFDIPTDIPAGTDVTLTAHFPATAAEEFLLYDPASQSLVTTRESLRISWFATGGALDVDATASPPDATSVQTTWHAPTAPGPAFLWLVLRDSRGGLATATATLMIH